MKIIVKIVLCTTLAFILSCVFLRAPQVHAQPTIDLAISPPTAYIKVKPGTTATHTVVIENLSDQLLKVSPTIVDFKSDNQTGVPLLLDETAFPYFDFDAKSLEPLTLPPKGKAQLALKMSIPSGVPNQEFPMTILFESQPNNEFTMAGATSQVRGSIGSNIIVLISSDSDVPAQLDIDSFKTSGIVDSFRPLKFTPVVTNSGYAGAAASGSAQILNWQGKAIKEYPIRAVVILANSSRELETNSADEAYTTDFYYKPLILLGIYKISVDLTVQNQGQSTHLLQTKTILALPISVLAIAILLPLLWWTYTHFVLNKRSK